MSETSLNSLRAAVSGRPLPVSSKTVTQPSPQERFVPQLIAARAAATPNHLAIACGNDMLSYADLERRSDQIAHRLQQFGGGPETLVGIYLERSVGHVVSALGILKAGAAYLPLDPAYPAQRVAFMLNDADVPLVVSGKHRSADLPTGRWQVINVDSDESQVSHVSVDSSTVNEDNLAYVIYTSGSTGDPKGVQITHKSLLNLVTWHQQTFGVGPDDRVAHLANPTFDAAVWELWPALAAGASVFLPDDAIRNEPERLRDWLVAERITITFVPTPLAERMIALEWPSNTALRTMLTGADTLRRYPPPGLPFALVNNYGPTECTVVASSGLIRPDANADGLPSIGLPIANTEIYILDDQMAQVPPGARGEIYIGGVALARGYLNNPALTAEKFVRNPFSSNPNSRLYKTGDLGRYLPDGQIGFVGRVDDQLKIRGFRIEPNEVSSALSHHPMLETCLVVGREDAPGDKRLVAYVIPKPGSQPTDQDLRSLLSSQLPAFMVPAIFVRIDSMPLNSSGKVDRTALPPPSESNILRTHSYVAARKPIEVKVTSILADLVRMKEIGLNDNFFLMGGNSLLGAQVIAQVRDRFGIELSLLSLFDHPTAAELSSEIEQLLIEKIGALSENEAKDLAAHLTPAMHDI